MSTNIEAFRVFIASPGDMVEERKAIREEISKFNDSHMHDLQIIFSAHGWESVPGGAGRAQQLINELVEQCDFMILVLGSRWGGTPVLDGKYSSGTEEEFYLAQECLGKDDAPMRDICVLFKGVPETQLRDPGEQLRKVMEFKKNLEASKNLFYKTFDEVEGLRLEVAMRLRAWAMSRGKIHQTNKTQELRGRPAILSSSSKHGGLKASETGTEASALASAEAFEANGLMTQAEAAYAKAIEDSDVGSLEKYARFLRRTGRLAKSLEINRLILAQLASAEDADETSGKRAHILANIGIVERKQGDLRASRYTLREAVETARQAGPDASDALAYSLDNLGITADRAGEPSEARELFKEALSVREMAGDTAGQAKSLTNLARLYKKAGNWPAAHEAASKAISLLQILDDRTALASAHSTMGEILEQAPDWEGAEDSYKTALKMNEALGMPDMIAMSLSQVARVLIERGDLAMAERYAQQALEENERTSNREGVTACTQLLGRIYGLTGRAAIGITMLEEAVAAYADTKNPTGEGWASFHLAELLDAEGRKHEAVAAMNRARAFASIVDNSALLARTETTETTKPLSGGE